MTAHKIYIELSKTRKLPCLWESGGCFAQVGSARIIMNQDGDAKKPMFIEHDTHISNCGHALIPIKVGDIVIDTLHEECNQSTVICKIVNIVKGDRREKPYADIKVLNRLENDEWENDIDEKFVKSGAESLRLTIKARGLIEDSDSILDNIYSLTHERRILFFT